MMIDGLLLELFSYIIYGSVSQLINPFSGDWVNLSITSFPMFWHEPLVPNWAETLRSSFIGVLLGLLFSFVYNGVSRNIRRATNQIGDKEV